MDDAVPDVLFAEPRDIPTPKSHVEEHVKHQSLLRAERPALLKLLDQLNRPRLMPLAIAPLLTLMPSVGFRSCNSCSTAHLNRPLMAFFEMSALVWRSGRYPFLDLFAGNGRDGQIAGRGLDLPSRSARVVSSSLREQHAPIARMAVLGRQSSRRIRNSPIAERRRLNGGRANGPLSAKCCRGAQPHEPQLSLTSRHHCHHCPLRARHEIRSFSSSSSSQLSLRARTRDNGDTDDRASPPSIVRTAAPPRNIHSQSIFRATCSCPA